MIHSFRLAPPQMLFVFRMFTLYTVGMVFTTVKYRYIIRVTKEANALTDVFVIGGGPAGISAALTAVGRGKSAMIVSTSPEDSLLWKAEKINNYAGLPDMTGAELLGTMLRHAESAGIPLTRGRVLSVLPMGGSFGVSVGSDFFECRAVIVAAGLSRARPFPGEAEHLGAGVSYCATCDGMLYRGKRVAVISLSSDGPEEAEYLRSIGCEVEFFDTKRAKKYEILGEGAVEALMADGQRVEVSGVFIFRSGVAPDSLVSGLAVSGSSIVVDGAMATSVPGVFACGDCVGAPYQIAKAVGEGNVAALSAAKYLENLAKEEK